MQSDCDFIKGCQRHALDKRTAIKSDCGNNQKNGRVCCTNYHMVNGKCEACPVGYFGWNCGVPCQYPAFGLFCTDECYCSQSKCSHLYGCISDDESVGSMAVYTRGSSESSEATTSYPIDPTSFGVNTTKKSPTTRKHYVITNSILKSNVSEEIQRSKVIISSVPPVTILPKLLSNNTLILVIGGLIAFFLFILSIQACVKLYACICLKTKSKQITQKTDLAIDEETYEDIYETMMTGISKANDPKQQGKYYQLKTLNNDTSMSYHKIDNTLERRSTENLNIEMKHELHSSLISNESTGSSNLYLKPGTSKHEKHNYIEVLDTASTNDELVKDCMGMPEYDASFSNYLEPIYSQHIDGNGKKSHDSTYLDVINEKPLEDMCFDLVHCTTGNKP